MALRQKSQSGIEPKREALLLRLRAKARGKLIPVSWYGPSDPRPPDVEIDRAALAKRFEQARDADPRAIWREEEGWITFVPDLGDFGAFGVGRTPREAEADSIDRLNEIISSLREPAEGTQPIATTTRRRCPGADASEAEACVFGDRVILCPRGLYVLWWDGDARRERQRLVGPPGLVRCWSLPVEIEGATLATVLAQLAALDTRSLDLLEDVMGTSVAPFLEELDGATAGGSPVTVIEVSKEVVVESGYFEKDSRPAVKVRLTADGRRGTPERMQDDLWLDSGPVREIVDAQLALCKAGKLLDTRRHPTRLIARFRAEFTLGELVSALLDEICFYGSPKRRDQHRQELASRLKKKGNGIPAAKVWKKLEAQTKREAPRLARIEEQLRRERHRGEKRPRGGGRR